MIGKKQQDFYFLWSRLVSAIAIFWRVFLIICGQKQKCIYPHQKHKTFFKPSQKSISPHKLFSPSFVREKNKRLFLISLSTLILTITFSGINLWFPPPAFAAATLRIEPLTFDHIGLDSNNVTVGPNQYLTGARVCNTGTEPAQNVQIQFIREGAFNPYIDVQNTLNTDTWVIPSLPGGSLPNLHHQQAAKPVNCFDAYYVATVARNAAAYNTVQKYRIEARADNASTASTNTAPGYYYYDTAHQRQLYVEKILSQARNEVISFENLTNPGSFTVEVGKNYDFRLTAKTATAYPQLTISSDFPNIVFQIVAVATTYSSDSGMTNSSVYADACGWLSDPNQAGYRASFSVCGGPVGNQDTTGDGKVGNTVTVNYTIKILESAGAGTYNVNHLILDFSGGSYHYNSDYGSGIGVTPIVVVERDADLQIEKSHTGNFSVGTNSYNLLVTNKGPDTATAPIRISDTLPAGFTFNSVGASSPNWSCSASGQEIICENPNDLLSGNTSTLVLNVDVSNTAADNVVNTATVSSSTRDPVLSNNTDSDPTTVIKGANISLSKDDNVNDPTEETFIAGQTATYRLTVSNSSGVNVDGPLTIVDTLPTGLSYSSASGTNWSCSANGQNVTCTNPNGLINGSTSNLNLTVNVLSNVASQITNTATVTSGSFDTNNTDNTATQTNSTTKPVPDLTISKTDNGQSFVVGQQGDYTITVTNKPTAGAATTGTITVIDTLPTGFAFVSGTSAPGSLGWSCSASGITVTCTNPQPLGIAQSTSILLKVTASTTAGTYINNVSVATPEEINVGDNTATESTPVLAAGTINLAIEKRLTQINSATGVNNSTLTNTSTACNTINPDLNNRTHNCPDLIQPGNEVIYAIDIINNSSGNGNDNNITFTDIVPSSLTGVTWRCNYVANNNIYGTPGGNKDLGVGNGVNSCNGTSDQELLSQPNSGNNISINTISLRKRGGNTTALGGKVRIIIRGTVTNNFAGTLSNTANTIPSAIADSDVRDNSYTVNATVRGADLTILKESFSNFVNGINGVYRLTVTNTGIPALSSTNLITVTDILPAGLNYVSASSAAGSSGWSCNYNSITRTVTCINPNPLAPEASTAINITVTPNATGSVTNNATVSTPGDINSNNNTAILTTTIAAPDPDVRITKTSGTLALGSVGTYTLSVGNSNAVGTTVAVAPIIITDTLPNGLAYLSGTGTGWICSANGQVVTCTNYSNIAPGNTLPALNINVLVGSQTALNITNTASVAQVPGENVSKLANNSTSLNSNIAPSADLRIVKTLSSSPLVPGETETYKLVVTNNGPSNVPSTVTVTDTLPSNLTFVSGSGGDFSCSAPTGQPQTVTCTNANGLNVGESTTITLNVTVALTATGNITNPASVSSSVNDPNLNNNNSSTTDPIQAATVDLAVQKTHFGSFSVGGQGTYSIQVANMGNTKVTDTPLIITDNLPNQLTLASFVGDSNWSCTGIGTANVSCNYANSSGLAPGESTFIDLIVNIGFSTPTGTNSITNRVDIIPVVGESNITNNTDDDPTTIQGSADLTVIKTDNDASFNPGETGTYDIVVTNNGASPAAFPITIVDQLPTGLTYKSFTSTDNNWSCPNASLGDVDIECIYTGTSGSLALNSSLSSLTITVDVDALLTNGTTLTNFVTVYSPTPDPNFDNNTDTEDTTIGNTSPLSPNVRLIKRITAVDSTNFTTFENDPNDENDNTDLNWSTNYLKGELIVDQSYTDSNNEVQYLEPGKEVEYTIYFLSDGGTMAKNVTLCDLVPLNQTFIQDAFQNLQAATGGLDGTSRGIAAEINTSLQSYTNAEDGDAARFYPAGSTLPSVCTLNGGVNTGGAVVINLGDIPKATAQGTPANSYGFLRFRAKVD